MIYIFSGLLLMMLLMLMLLFVCIILFSWFWELQCVHNMPLCNYNEQFHPKVYFTAQCNMNLMHFTWDWPEENGFPSKKIKLSQHPLPVLVSVSIWELFVGNSWNCIFIFVWWINFHPCDHFHLLDYVFIAVYSLDGLSDEYFSENMFQISKSFHSCASGSFQWSTHRIHTSQKCKDLRDGIKSYSIPWKINNLLNDA